MGIETHIKTKCFTLHIQGLVQGVGFRPFIYRLANELKLNGQVENRNDGVFIKVNGSEKEVKHFEKKILEYAPPASQIQSISIKESNLEPFQDFQIIKSNNVSNEITQVSPDIAICDDCLKDIEQQTLRINYPFTNCTNCGPRFSIIKELPYDRPFTTMNSFAMCDNCRSEYTNFLDRRFHAQPIACNNCGPIYKLEDNNSQQNINEIIGAVSTGIEQGKVYAIKGVGGFHLMCDAKNKEAVNRIREIKNRDGKPFAVMAASNKEIEKIASFKEEEQKLLLSWQRPIVLLKYIGGLAPGVTNGLNKVGILLPYMPFHYLLFKKLKSPFIVLTSGNLSDEPITIHNQKAISIFNKKVDNILTYNRDIHNRVDDSVSMVINNSARIIRRSRGYAPQPIITNLNTEGIFAAGAELTSSFSVGKGNQAIMSQYIGDLKNTETLEFYEETYNRFEKLFQFKPQLIAMDLHPDYMSSQFAKDLSKKYNVPFIKIQHHHAHIASVMATNGLTEEVIGVSFDGIGLGTDHNIWGAECIVADLEDFERIYHFDYIPLPGGDKASKEPWRIGLSYLFAVYGDKLFDYDLPIFNDIENSKIENIIQILKKKINTPLASSAGRLFDAVASLIGVCHFNSFQAEAPMRLESLVREDEKGFYKFEIKQKTISFNNTIKQIVNDYIDGISAESISTKFHNTIVELTVKLCADISYKEKIHKIVLSGGTFQNAYLVKNIEDKLISKGLEIYLPKDIPVNDQGISLGQLAIAAHRRELNKI